MNQADEMLAGRLREFCGRLDEAEQKAIESAEQASREIFSSGTEAASERRIVAGRQELDEWVTEPANDARADAAGILLIACANVLWRRTNAESEGSVEKFLANVGRLAEVLLERYGMAAQGQVAQLQNDLRRNLEFDRMSPKGSAEGQEQVENGEPMCKPASIVQSGDILQFFTEWGKRKRREAYLNAVCARHLGINAAEAERQEELLNDARDWAKADLTHTALEARDITELKERTIKRTWDYFLPTSPDRAHLRLGFREFGSAIWEEGWPSVEDHAVEALLHRARSSQKAGSPDERVMPAVGASESEDFHEGSAIPPRIQGRLGRLPRLKRRNAIQSAINKYGEDWRDHLLEICNELDAADVFLGNFQGFQIDLGDGQLVRVSKWSDLDLTQSTQRKRLIDVLRKYRGPVDGNSAELIPIPSN